MSTPSLGTLRTSLLSADSFHPTLLITLPSPNVPANLHSQACDANLLVHLPSGVFYDPFTASNTIINGGARKARRGEVLTDSRVELEAAVGWTARPSAKAERQWWERAEADERRSVDMQDVLSAALRQAAGQVVTDQLPVKLSLDKDRARVKASDQNGKQNQSQTFKQERSTVVIPVPVDELLTADGLFQVHVPLHVRYHPPATRDTREPSGVTLIREIAPSSLRQLYYHVLERLGHSSTRPSTLNQHAKITLLAPNLYISCSDTSSTRSPASLLPPSHAHLQPQLMAHLTSTGTQARHIVALASSLKNDRLALRVPVPDAAVLDAVHGVTMLTVVGAAVTVAYHLLVNVVPLLEGVEKLG
ncbi:uncharacterized protein UMAG_06241 [Mycosarcoma maydis]|uniref:Uncharacterized protein n=1 Tax=Mycosarcoma maydis TaxID=5270 RepID=A0A0D1DP92_MYCMD|nr:uncharacterized protein UMAG_06241 [Ustilago maydis 521]KIS65866.1 hypothetical protein UMAG_06241 [Ustilago maydis 521]|eukprot:XP_011392591.1 hypothetical protein UMAG_06241 [Ustilago maydis 521]